MNRAVIFRRWAIGLIVVFVGSLVTGREVYGQAGLRESLERLDRNENGNIDPDEITPLARPFLERIAEARRIDLDRENSIEKFQEAARIYHALINGVSGRKIRPAGQPTVMQFGPEPGKPLVPEFGLPELKYEYLQEDLDEADRTLRRSDRNQDGYIDRAEARRAEWTHRDPFEMDLDQDDRLSRMELTQRYARRRLLDDAASELVKKARRTGSEVRPVQRQDSRRDYRRDSRYYLPATVMGRFDQNRDGRLEPQETMGLGLPTSKLDVNRDGELSREEINAYMLELQDDVSGLSDGLPIWFFELDVNRDEQIAMAEFSSEWTEEKLAEFEAYDLNGDGLLTPEEILDSSSVSGGMYRSSEGVMLPPRKTVISEIEVSDDFVIGDLNVQLSITHTYAGHLDVYLTGPEGERVELFTEVGGSDDHFDQTILDDQSRYPITKAKAPFRGTYMPEALLKRQPSLSSFNGKSIKGVWQLVIRCSRSDRFGMLHSWSLIAKPQDDLRVLSEPTEDGRPSDAQTQLSKPSGAPTSVAVVQESPIAKALTSSFQFRPEKDWDQMEDNERVEAIDKKQQAYEKYKAFLAKKKQQAAEKRGGN